jgi:hypothetical protein
MLPARAGAATGRAGAGRGRAARGAADGGPRERGRGTRPAAAGGPGRRQGTVGGNGSRTASWHQDSPRSAPRPRASFVTFGSWFFSRFAFGAAAQLLEVGQLGRAWCHNFANHGQNEVPSPHVVHHAHSVADPRSSARAWSNGATTSPNPRKTKFRHHTRVSVECLSPALPCGIETMRGATTSPHTGKTKLCHHRFICPACPLSRSPGCWRSRVVPQLRQPRRKRSYGTRGIQDEIRPPHI